MSELVGEDVEVLAVGEVVVDGVDDEHAVVGRAVWTSPSGTETVTVSGSENSGPQQEARTGPGGSPVQLDGRGVLLGRSE